jgi:hypothetical protein
MLRIEERGKRTGEFRGWRWQSIIGIHIACLINKLTFLPVKGLEVRVADVGRQCIWFPAAGFASSFTVRRRKGTPEARKQTLHGFGGLRHSIAPLSQRCAE